MSHSFQNVKVTRDTERWETEIRAEIPVEVLTRYRGLALKDIQKTAKLDGFRPGKAPEDRIIAVYGEAQILRHAVEHAIENELPLLLAAEKLPIVEAPRVTTDTPTLDKPVTFTARAALARGASRPRALPIGKTRLKMHRPENGGGEYGGDQADPSGGRRQ